MGAHLPVLLVEFWGLLLILYGHFFYFFSVSHHTRRCLGTCQAIGYNTCLSMEKPTAVFPGTALHSGTASAVSRRLCTRPWVPRRWISAGPCVTTPCGIYSSGSRDRPTPGSQDFTTTCPAPKPWWTCRNTLSRCIRSHPPPPMARSPCTGATPRCDPTACSVLVRRCLLPSTEEIRALRDGRGHSTARSVKC